jgi:hypothetical protein
MIGWLLARPRLIAYGLAGAVLTGGLLWAGLTVRGWHRDSLALPLARRGLVEAQATNAALVAAVHRAAEVSGAAEVKVETAGREAAKVRTVYREAVRTDPTCAEWHRTRIACPLVTGP